MGVEKSFMETIDIIKNVRKLLSDETRWIVETLAVNRKYERVDPEDENACAWCLTGAIDYVCFINGMTHTMNNDVFRYIESKLGLYGSSIPNFNDHADTTHTALMSFLDNAISEYPQIGTL
jgi:hypothetical protein